MYDKERFDQIQNKTTSELISFIAMKAAFLHDDPVVFSKENDYIFENETIWAIEELEKRFSYLNEDKLKKLILETIYEYNYDNSPDRQED